MHEIISQWWEEVKGNKNGHSSEVTKKEFLRFALKKRIIVDEKELDSLFKDLTGDASIAERQTIKKSEFMRIFLRPCFKGTMQNIYEFIDKSTVLLKSLPQSLKILSY